MKTYKFTISAIMIACISLQVNAERSGHHDSGLEAHVHGVSELTLAMEGKVLEIEFISPAMNLVGFEHQARTENDMAALEIAQLVLAKADELFLISGTACTLVSASTDVSAVLEDSHSAPSHAAKSDAHKHDPAPNDSHSEITANYHYHCENMAELASISVALFEHFSGVHHIRVMWVKEAQQGAKKLNNNDNRILFK